MEADLTLRICFFWVWTMLLSRPVLPLWLWTLGPFQRELVLLVKNPHKISKEQLLEEQEISLPLLVPVSVRIFGLDGKLWQGELSLP